MAKYSKKAQVSGETRDEAMKIARGTQKPGQTKEQTKLIAQGIQKGIDLYKKQHKVKARELDKKLKKAMVSTAPQPMQLEAVPPTTPQKSSKLPWILLLLSWLCFGVYFFLTGYAG
ncbi:MAG: DUF2956 domain-containing protein [endosymbiont of Seepiophila jonesi]|uniref:DUF2956 domain-containing protein n=1 Tax=endosymbiont of Lamellibrachia luymesi TaxID=2200907 RepID=A0A370DZ83_9GAMM|nr:MAG: DUF2956 domain-containing protein [endosymbiont of Lamellibrachia luymesi]RDH94561.1 MAG: DUF2956 domain-containing protein [endosymbiont of Seepiophila jonesi]